MSFNKKIDLSNINAIDVHYVIQPEKIYNSTESNKAKEMDSILVDDHNSYINSIFKDLFKLSIKGVVTYSMGGLNLIRDIKGLSVVVSDLIRLDLNSIKNRAFKSTIFIPKLQKIQNLIHYKMFEQAIKEIQLLEKELESIDDYQYRVIINTMEAQIHMIHKRYQRASELFMIAAKIGSSNTSKIINTEAGKAYTSLKAFNYLMALESLAVHVKSHGLIEDTIYTFDSLAKDAVYFFEREKEYHELKINKYKMTKKGEFKIGKYSIPYGWFSEDEVSSPINQRMISKIDRLKTIFKAKIDQSEYREYLKEYKYKEQSIELLFVKADELCEIDCSNFIKELNNFFNYFISLLEENNFTNEEIVKVKIMRASNLIKYQDTNESDLLQMFKFLDLYKEDNEIFNEIFLMTERMSMSWKSLQRQQYAEIILSKSYRSEQFRVLNAQSLFSIFYNKLFYTNTRSTKRNNQLFREETFLLLRDGLTLSSFRMAGVDANHMTNISTLS